MNVAATAAQPTLPPLDGKYRSGKAGTAPEPAVPETAASAPAVSDPNQITGTALDIAA